jgi:hypothetical protein
LKVPVPLGEMIERGVMIFKKYLNGVIIYLSRSVHCCTLRKITLDCKGVRKRESERERERETERKKMISFELELNCHSGSKHICAMIYLKLKASSFVKS